MVTKDLKNKLSDSECEQELASLFDGELAGSRLNILNKQLALSESDATTYWLMLEEIRDGVKEWHKDRCLDESGRLYQCSVWDRLAPQLRKLSVPCESSRIRKRRFDLDVIVNKSREFFGFWQPISITAGIMVGILGVFIWGQFEGSQHLNSVIAGVFSLSPTTHSVDSLSEPVGSYDDVEVNGLPIDIDWIRSKRPIRFVRSDDRRNPPVIWLASE